MERTESVVQGVAPPERSTATARAVAVTVIVLTLFVGLHAYIGSRLIYGFGLHGGWAALGWCAVGVLSLSIPAAFFASRILPRPWAAPVYWVAHLWVGLFGLLLTIVAGTDILRLAITWIGRLGPAETAEAGRLQAWAILGLVVPTALVGYRVARGPARIERVIFGVRDLGPGLDGLRIVQISDLHIGETLRGAFLSRVVDQVNALDPDVVAITGDLVDGSVYHLRDEVSPLSRLRARHGVYFVTGNHEYYHGGAAWEAEVRRLGITVLHNSHVVVERSGDRLVVAGIPDLDGKYAGAAPDVRRALQGVPEEVPRILLAHQPRMVSLCGGERIDLQLSGHTHGGQIFPFMFFVRLQQPAVRGLSRVNGHWVYTHRGTGYWGPPFRVGTSPEIAEITLTRE